ncbi:MAG: zinc ABC transporter substrate-binding protein, partial [bacterium]|nr:zinc ABC transporter substrate-binding protein [bacterium]
MWKTKKTYLNILLVLMLLAGGIIVSYIREKSVISISDSDRLNIVTTLFPTYDFVQQIGGDKVNVTLLLPPGMEPHAFEPTPRDIIEINDSKVFIYTGRYMEPWVEGVLQGLDNQGMIVVDASSHVKNMQLEG